MNETSEHKVALALAAVSLSRAAKAFSARPKAAVFHAQAARILLTTVQAPLSAEQASALETLVRANSDDLATEQNKELFAVKATQLSASFQAASL